VQSVPKVPGGEIFDLHGADQVMVHVPHTRGQRISVRLPVCTERASNCVAVPGMLVSVAAVSMMPPRGALGFLHRRDSHAAGVRP
jgi:hypothetical protein